MDVFVDGKRAGGHGTFMKVAADMACKDILSLFLQGHAVEYYPLPDPTIVILMCIKFSDTIQRKQASDVGSLQDRSVFIDFFVSMAMREIPTIRFTFKCTRLVENCRPRQDPIVLMLARKAEGCSHLPIPRQRSTMTAIDDVLYNDIRTYMQDQGVGLPAYKFRQFFKRPLVANCDCISCTKGMFIYVFFATFILFFMIFSFGICFSIYFDSIPLCSL